MAAEIIDGKTISRSILSDTHQRSAELMTRGTCPKLGVISSSGDSAADSYARMRLRAARKAGVEIVNIQCEAAEGSSDEVTEKNRSIWYSAVNKLSSDPAVHAILIQAPLPAGLSMMELAALIPPEKDVDGQNPINQGALLALQSHCFSPCTPEAAIEVLSQVTDSIAGKHVTILGRSQVVGLPLALMLLRRGINGDATVTVCHTRTPDASAYTAQADIVITAAGAPGYLKGHMIKPGAVLIDVGMTSIADNSTKSGWKLMGDVDIASCAPIASKLTPTPGGIGPVTTAILLKHTVQAAYRQGSIIK